MAAVLVAATVSEAAFLSVRLYTVKSNPALSNCRAMLSKIERGENNPTLVVAVKVAVALGLTTAQLIGVEEQKQAIKAFSGRAVFPTRR